MCVTYTSYLLKQFISHDYYRDKYSYKYIMTSVCEDLYMHLQNVKFKDY